MLRPVPQSIEQSNAHAGVGERPSSDFLIGAFLICVTAIVFWPVLGFPFHIVDDAEYATQQPMVNQGFRSAAFSWTLTQAHSANWHPLTTVAHMGVCEFFALDPRAHHAANLILHSLNAALCFAAFRRLTGRQWESAFVAAVFALHPLRVESVAWVSELKDLLCGAFWFLALWAYARYAERRTRQSYALVAVATAAALLSKPMAVTLPATLLLLDFWPLRRWPAEPWWRLVREKGWLFLLSVAQGMITLQVQHGAGAGGFGGHVTFDGRIGNTVVAYARYVWKFVWPTDLSAFYPHPGYWHWEAIVVAGAVVIGAVVTASRCARSSPWVSVGILWFFGTLVPAIGMIQVGSQSMADRYTYIPMLGLSIAGVWAAAPVFARLRGGRAVAIGASAILLTVLGWGSRMALVPWKDSVTVLERARELATHPGIIRSYLGNALRQAGRIDEAEDQFRALVREEPWFSDGWLQLASLLTGSVRADEAGIVLREAVEAMPNDASAWNNLGVFLMDSGMELRAAEALKKAESLEPRDASVQNNLGLLSTKRGEATRAEQHFRDAVRLDRWNTDYSLSLAVTLERNGGWKEARELLNRALWINPRDSALLRNTILLFAKHGQIGEAERLRAYAARWAIEWQR